MQAIARSIPSRQFAHPLDKRLRDFEQKTHGVGRSNEAIGGCYGIGWYERFEDRETGEVYQVHCSDGVYGGKDSYMPEDMRWMSKCYRSIVDRTLSEAVDGAVDICLSRNEWIVMQQRIHAGWLDPKKGENRAKQADCTIEAGLIGHIMDVPVIVDLDKKDELPSR